MNSTNVALAQYIKHGLWIARNKSFSFIHKDISVKLWIHGNNGGTPQNM